MFTHGLPQSLFAALLACVAFLAVSELQESLVTQVDLGVSAPYLPAGVRLIAAAVLGFAGCMGVALASLVVAGETFPDAGAGLLVAVALLSGFLPLVALIVVRRVYAIGDQLRELVFRQLLVLVALQSVLSPLAHQALYALSGMAPANLGNLLAMIVGDMVGCMLVVVLVASVWRRFRPL
jgi:hypothetical protein